MQKTQSMAFFSMITGILAILCLCLIAIALRDILLAMEPSISTGWHIVKIGVPAFIVLQILSIGGLFRMLKVWQDEK